MRGYLVRWSAFAAVVCVTMVVLFFFQNCGIADHPFKAASVNEANSPQPQGEDTKKPPPVVGPEGSQLCPVLDLRQGALQVETVKPSQASALPGLVQSAVQGTVFLLEPGTYSLSSTLQFNTKGLRLTSTTGKPEDVILDGGHQGGSVIQISAEDVSIANVTVRRSYYHLIHFVDGGRNGQVYNVHMEDGRQQFIKSSSFSDASDNVEVGCSSFVLTAQGRTKVDPDAGGCYTGGIDAHRSRDWWVHDNYFQDIYCDNGGLAEHAIHFWNSGRDPIVERNHIVNCARGIGFGLGQTKSPVGRVYSDYPNIGTDANSYIGHIGGVIRNNMIYADTTNRFDTGIGLEQAYGVKVYHNTVYSIDPGTFTAFDVRFVNSNPEVANNIFYPKTTLRGGGALASDIKNVVPETSWFIPDPEVGVRLDLTKDEVKNQILDQGQALPDLKYDFEGQERDSSPDIGADEAN